MNIKSHEGWIREIQKYEPSLSDEEVVKFCLSYTLQSLREEEDLYRFRWRI